MNIGSIVLFSRPNGEQTRGRILKVNSKTFKVQILEARGSFGGTGAVWTVAKSLCRPADASLEAQRSVAIASLNVAAQTDLVASAMRKLTGQELSALQEHFKKYT